MANLSEIHSQYADPFERLFDGEELWLPVVGVGSSYPSNRDRPDGADWQIYRNDYELTQRRNLCRYLCAWNEIATGLLDKLANYVIGDGFKFRAESEDANRELAAAVQSYIDSLLDANDFPSLREREFFTRRHRDGECIIAIFPDGRGRCALRAVEPGLIRQPPRSEADQAIEDATVRGWLDADCCYSISFGVVTPEHDVEKVVGVFVEWDPSRWQFLPAHLVEFHKGNVDLNVKRGISDFWPVINRLDRAARLQKITTEGAMAQAAIAYVVEHVSGTAPDAVRTRLDQFANFQRVVQTAYGSRTDRYASPSSAAVKNIDAGKQYKPGPMGAERASYFLETVNQGLRLVGSRWSMPEYLVTSDASNGNFASTLVAGEPFVKNCETLQRRHGWHFTNMLWKCLAVACDYGVFGGVSYEELKAAVVIRCEGAPVAVRDKLKESQQNELLSRNGLLSDATWAAREGLDYERERKNGVAKQQPQALFGMPQPQPVSEAARAEVRKLWETYGGDPCC